MNLQVQLDGSQRADLLVRVVIRVPPGVRLIEDGGLKLASPLGSRFLDDGTGRSDLSEDVVQAELERRLLEHYVAWREEHPAEDPAEQLWSFESVEVQR